MTMKIALLPGDGIGPEIVREAKRVIDALARGGLAVETAEAPIGGAGVDAAGHPLPDATLALARASDAVLMGAVGGPKYDTLPRALPSAKPAAPPATAAAAAPGAAAELEPKRRAISPGAPAPDSADRAAAPAPPPAPAQAQARTQAQAAKIAVPESRTMAEGRVGVDTREAPPGSAGGGSPALRDRLDSGAPRRERASTQTGAGAPVTDARRAAEAAPATMSPPRLGASASAAGKSIDAYVAEIRRHLAGGDVESARRELAALRSAHADADDRLPEDLRRWAAGIPR